MKTRTRVLALLLCLSLLAGLLAGCSPAPQEEPAAPAATAAAEVRPTPDPTPEPSPEPTPAPIDYRGLYAQAARNLAGRENVSVSYRITQEIALPDCAAETPGGVTTLRELTERQADYTGLGGDGLRAVVSDSIKLGDYPFAQKLVYADGVEYVAFSAGWPDDPPSSESLFYSEVAAGDFLAGQLPLLLLDETLYEALEGEETEAGGYTLHFAAPADAENWALPEHAALLDAEGGATLSTEGELTGADYELRYTFGGLTVRYHCEAAYELPKEPNLSGEIPENAKQYESLDDPRAPLMVTRALWLLYNANAVEAAINSNYFCEAAATTLRGYDQISLLNRGTGFLMHEETSLSAMDYSTRQSYSNSYESDYADGTLEVRFDDGDSYNEAMTIREIRDYAFDFILRYFPGPDSLKDAEIQDVGDYYLIRFAGTEDFGLQLKAAACQALFSDDPDILDRYATAYVTTAAEGFLAVEKVSGIPTALNLSYAGVHTIENAPCQLAMELNIGLGLYTEEAGGHIYDEPLPAPEPEQKATPVFYEVRDEAGHVLYLLGTIHIGDDRTAYLPQVIYDALDASDALAVEFDAERFFDKVDEDPELQTLLAESYYYLDGTTIQNHLDSEIYKAALDLIRVSGNYTDTAENMKPYVWMSGIEQFYLAQGRRLSPDKGVDNRLERLARDVDKEILDVESGEFQVGLLAGYSDPVQEMLLAETAAISRSEYLEESYALYEAWCQGDEEALIQRLAAMDEEEREALDEDELAIYDEYHQKMEVERNAAMVEVAKGYLDSDRTVFFAVGLAHLLGEGGLVHALREAGYTVTLIDTH